MGIETIRGGEGGGAGGESSLPLLHPRSCKIKPTGIIAISTSKNNSKPFDTETGRRS